MVTPSIIAVCELDVIQFTCLALELVAEFGVGDVDELDGALADGLGVQVGHAVFGHHVAHVVAGGNYAGAVVEQGDDAADGLAVFERGGAGQGDDRHAAL